MSSRSKRSNRPRARARQPLAKWLTRGWGVVALSVWLWPPARAWAFGGSAARVWLPEGISTVAPIVDRLFYLILWVTGAVFVLVEGTLLVFLVRYRRQPGRRATYTHGNPLAETIWTVVPALILIYLAFYNQRVWSQVRGTPPSPDLEVEITAEQFAWNIRYAGDDGRLNTLDDLTTINQLHLPVHQTVLVHLKSKDVIHSFFVPQFRFKLDAVPGVTGRLWVEPVKEGHWEIACAELCGLGHYRMRGFLTVESPQAFHVWMANTKTESGS